MGDCTAKIRPMLPENDAEVSCIKLEPNHNPHEGVLTSMRPIIKWFESDRRNFHNEWPGSCTFGDCFLPLGHHGAHVTPGKVI